MIDTTFDQAKKIITKDLDNWNSNFWRLRCREQVIIKSRNPLKSLVGFLGDFKASKGLSRLTDP